MTAQFPIHFDDEQQLLKIRRYLIGFRKTNGWNQPTLSQMVNGTDGVVYDLESNMTWQWRLSRLQDWTTPFGLRLTMRFTLGEEIMDAGIHDHPEVAPVFALSQSPGAWKKWQRIYITSVLTGARQYLGLSPQAMAQRLGITAKALCNWEATADELMLSKVLFHARALDGWFELGYDDE